MTEDYLHYIWKHGLFNQAELKTTDGEEIELLNRGNHNANAGPNFLEARVKIGNAEWAGHAEIHIRSSDWNKHNHQTDKAYNNVVLHVVYEDDGEAFRQSGSKIPTFQLKGRFDELGYWRYEQFVGNKKELACENLLKSVDDIHMQSMLNRVLLERLERKADRVLKIFEASNSDWNETFYRLLMHAFGLKVNAQNMLDLAARLPLSVLRKHKGNPWQIEALIFGASGLLSDDDDYAIRLKKEFQFLAHKYNLKQLEAEQWKFARMRPAGFPTVRLAQLSAIFNNHIDFFSFCLEINNVADFVNKLSEKPADYWQNHYRFGKQSKPVSKAPAKAFVEKVVVNAMVPALFAYSVKTKNELLRERAIDWLEQLKAESNTPVKHAKSIGFNIETAADSQSFLELRNNYCSLRKCLNCAIGVKLLRQ